MRYLGKIVESMDEEATRIAKIELALAMDALYSAGRVARRSECKKSQRGVVITYGEHIIGEGYNKPLNTKLCDPCVRENLQGGERVELCEAIHAEEMALLDIMKYYSDNKYRLKNKISMLETLRNSRAYHVKVEKIGRKDIKLLTSKKPLCPPCSKSILYSEIPEFVLFHEDGIAVYSAEEFNDLSKENAYEEYIKSTSNV